MPDLVGEQGHLGFAFGLHFDAAMLPERKHWV